MVKAVSRAYCFSYEKCDSSDLKIILGRNFSPKDFKNKADKIIINNEFMKENYPNYDTGDIIQIGNIEYEIIGICANAENDIYITYNHLQNEKDAFNLRQVVIRFSHMLNHSQKEILDSMAEVKQLIYDNADTLMEYVSCVFLILINLVIFGTTIVCLNRILSENYCKVYHLYHVLGIHDGYLLFSKIFVFVMIEILVLFTMLSIYNPFNLVYRSFIK